MLAMVDQVLTEIVKNNGADYDHAISLLKKLHDRPRSTDDAINKILGDL